MKICFHSRLSDIWCFFVLPLSCLDEIGASDTRNTCIEAGSGKIWHKTLFPNVCHAIFEAEISALERRNSDFDTISIAQISENEAAIGTNGLEMSKSDSF